MAALISRGQRRGSERGVVLLGVELRDAREEMFVLMVCDGLPLRLAFARAGFTAKNHDAPSKLFHLSRVQERARAILEARRTQGVVSLSEVTSMLQRVFAGAHSEGEYNAAHNAAFSLARLYGHVTDKATLEVIRRPSRDPDAPSEQALGDWVAALPVVSGPSPCLETPSPGLGAIAAAPTGLGPPNLPPEPSGGPPRGAPAPLLGPEPQPGPEVASPEGPATSGELRYGVGPEGPGPGDAATSASDDADASGPQRELSNEINWLAWPGRGDGGVGIGNGAPVTPVTGTPYERGGSAPLEPAPHERAHSSPSGPVDRSVDNSAVVDRSVDNSAVVATPGGEQNGSPFSSKGTCPGGGSEPLAKLEAFPGIRPCQAPRLRPPGEKRVPSVPKRVPVKLDRSSSRSERSAKPGEGPVKNREKLAKVVKRKRVPRIPSTKDLFPAAEPPETSQWPTAKDLFG